MTGASTNHARTPVRGGITTVISSSASAGCPSLRVVVAPCARCGLLIRAGAPWDLDHHDTDKTRTHPSHRACNRATATHSKQRRDAIARAPRPKALEFWQVLTTRTAIGITKPVATQHDSSRYIDTTAVAAQQDSRYQLASSQVRGRFLGGGRSRPCRSGDLSTTKSAWGQQTSLGFRRPTTGFDDAGMLNCVGVQWDWAENWWRAGSGRCAGSR